MKKFRPIHPSVLVFLLLLPSLALASGDSSPPEFKGEGEITEFVPEKTGASFDIGAGVQVFVPAGVKGAGVTTFSRSTDRPSDSLVAKSFSRHGPTVVFDSELSSKKGPVKVVFNLRREPKRSGLKFVLGVEFSGECTGKAKRNELEDGSCGHWKLYDTKFDEKLGGMVAEVDKTGGYRMQFGWIDDK
ncbi:MAG: hypothetical protein OEZ06_29470 [Myxococcales bacterium]|nr:hypothetical protein [Myxococcales bacterium]